MYSMDNTNSKMLHSLNVLQAGVTFRPKEQYCTVPKPFSFEETDKKRRAEKEEQIRQNLEERNKATKFRATPPNLNSRSQYLTPKEDDDLTDLDTSQAPTEKVKNSKLQPTRTIDEINSTSVAGRSKKSLTLPKSFTFATERRAMERKSITLSSNVKKVDGLTVKKKQWR